MKKFFSLPVFLMFLLVPLSCEKDRGLNLEKVNGYVQKGPYLNGTPVTITELTEDLVPTGKNFTSQILDNKGTFEVKNVDLVSDYAELKADGFYFNEVQNENSAAQLTLFALSDLSDKSSLNVNVLTNLEKSRVDYLVSNGMAFAEAKKQAQKEILSVFEISKDDMPESEDLDISKEGDDNAILLAVSVILQGYLPVAGLSELMANISTDIREDGILNSQSLGSMLINNAKLVKPDMIRHNLESRYENLGMEVTVPDFEKYIAQFIDNTDFVFTAVIDYPAAGKFGENVLDREKTGYASGNYSMKAILPEGTMLKVKIKSFNLGIRAFQEDSGWEYTSWNRKDSTQIFTSVRTGEIDLEVNLHAFHDSAWSNKSMIYVFENGDTIPTWSKEVIVY